MASSKKKDKYQDIDVELAILTTVKTVKTGKQLTDKVREAFPGLPDDQLKRCLDRLC
ncbi:hypothetical protein Peetri_00016 [Pseudomonas phage vB_PpuM-Peetri]